MDGQKAPEELMPTVNLREREKKVVECLVQWAEGCESVRAMLLYSSRVNPNAALDCFSDFDVLLAVRNAPAFYADERWLQALGSVLVVFRNPLGDREGFPASLFVTHYDNGLKVDYAFVETGFLEWLTGQERVPDDLDHGYRVLIDKDALAVSLPPPTFSAFRPSKPDERTYHELIEEFFNDAAYVAKALRRGDLLPAKLSLDHVMKCECFCRMLDWRFGVETNWAIPSRAHGKGLRQRLGGEMYAELERTYVGAGVNENWEALWGTISLFRRVALDVAEGLGFAYPHDQDRRVTAYLKDVQEGLAPR